ncbi:MAG: DMT family transporter [Gammaproteobacteria bacterium]|nr:MAG: DMT family transporter [Gammaproteobacteria bacterium]
MNDTMRGALQMTTAMAISGTIGWFVVVSGAPVVDIVFWRCLLGAVTLALVCAAKKFLRRDAITWRQAALAVLGGVAIVGNWLLLFAAYPRASISIATAVYNTQPFMLVGLGAVLFRERLTATKLGWLSVAFAGMLLIVRATPDLSDGADYVGGIALALGAAFLYAIAAIVAKRLQGVRPHLIALIQVTVGSVLLAPLVHWNALPASAATWTLLGTLGIVHTGFMYILLYSAIQKLPTSLTGALSFIYPIVAIAVDALAFGHRLHAWQFVGASAILIAAAGMTFGWSWRTLRFAARRAESPHAPCEQA